jgi:hypothetical protein
MITLARVIWSPDVSKTCLDSQPLSSKSELRLGDIDASNAAEMRSMFERIFAKPMSEAFWRWKYRADRGHALGVWQGDRLVAHYGGIGADIVMDGKASRAVQIVDVMVDPAVRNSVRKTSPFFLATSTFLNRFIGYKQPYLLGYGFPSHRHLQLAERLNLYAAVGEMSELQLSAKAAKLDRLLYRWQQVPGHLLQKHESTLNRLWQQMQQSLPAAILVRKDVERLRYRYVEHPEHQYEFWLLRRRLTNKALAVVVLKPEPGRVLLMDVIADLAALPNALMQTARLVQQRWQQPLAAWLSTAQVPSLRLSDRYVQVKPLPICTPANIWTEGPQPAELKDRWWLMAGDTDFL